MVLLEVGWLRTVRAKTAHEPLCDNHFHRGSDQEGLDVHIGQTGECAGSIVGVQRAEHEVAGE